MKTMLSGLLFFFLFLYPAAGGENFTARIYRQGTGEEDLLFTMKSEETTESDGEKKVHRYYTPDGEIFAEESLLLQGKGRFLHRVSFYAMDEYSRLESDGNAMKISFRREEERKEKVLGFKDDLLFGPSQQGFIIDNLSRLQGGETLHFALPVAELTTTAEFYLRKAGTSPYAAPGRTVLEMGSRNFFVRLLVDRVFYVIDEDTGLIQEIHGPSLLRTREGGKWKQADVDIRFFYE
ncbi:MAG: hypothetical protein JXA95_03190 [Spirochaetales bacterium]|nr:hypothetical protein [Spirochaetales bacterium]